MAMSSKLVNLLNMSIAQALSFCDMFYQCGPENDAKSTYAEMLSFLPRFGTHPHTPFLWYHTDTAPRSVNLMQLL